MAPLFVTETLKKRNKGNWTESFKIMMKTEKQNTVALSVVSDDRLNKRKLEVSKEVKSEKKSSQKLKRKLDEDCIENSIPHRFMPNTSKKRRTEKREQSVELNRQFKARPLNLKIFNSHAGQVGVPRVAKKAPTLVKEFNLTTSTRRKQQSEQEKESESKLDKTNKLVKSKQENMNRTHFKQDPSVQELMRCVIHSNYTGALHLLKHLSAEELDEIPTHMYKKMIKGLCSLKLHCKVCELLDVVLQKDVISDESHELYKIIVSNLGKHDSFAKYGGLFLESLKKKSSQSRETVPSNSDDAPSSK